MNLLDEAFGDAQQGKSVFYQSADSRSAAYIFAEARARVEADFTGIDKIYLAPGEQRILFGSGGRILFGAHEGRGITIDTHIIDGSTADFHPTATRTIRSVLE